MGDSEIKRISGREGWSDEAHEEHGPTLKQKVPEKNMWTQFIPNRSLGSYKNRESDK